MRRKTYQHAALIYYNTDYIDLEEFKVSQGKALPRGCTVRSGGINFSIYTEDASIVWLQLYESGEHAPIAEIALCPKMNKTGDVWHVLVEGIYSETLRYAYRMDKLPNPDPQRYPFDFENVLLDPYAKG